MLGLTTLALAQVSEATIQSAYERTAVIEAHFQGAVIGWTQTGAATHIEDGYFLTARHIVFDEILGYSKDITIDGAKANIKLSGVTWDWLGDWTLLYTTLDYDNTRWTFTLVPCEYIFRIGNDYGRGLVPAIGLLGTKVETGCWATTMSVRGGASGGGVYNKRGELIGICVAAVAGDDSYMLFNPVRAEMLKPLLE